MKKEKTVEEYYCDFCGNECTDEHYDVTLPFKQTDGYTSRFAPENPDDKLIAIHNVKQTVEIDLSDPAFKKDPLIRCVTRPDIDNTMILNYKEVQ